MYCARLRQAALQRFARAFWILARSAAREAFVGTRASGVNARFRAGLPRDETPNASRDTLGAVQLYPPSYSRVPLAYLERFMESSRATAESQH